MLKLMAALVPWSRTNGESGDVTIVKLGVVGGVIAVELTVTSVLPVTPLALAKTARFKTGLLLPLNITYWLPSPAIPVIDDPVPTSLCQVNVGSDTIGFPY